MEELDIREILNYFWEKIFYFFVILLIVLTIGIAYSLFIQKPLYTSKTSLILTGFSSETTGNATITQSDLTVNSKLVSTYQKIVKSRRVLNQVIENLDLDYETTELAKYINVTSVSDTEIIEISVSNENAKQAYLICNEVAKVFSSEVKDLYNLSNVSILDYAEVQSTPSNINFIKQLLIYLVVGLILAFVIIFIWYYFDMTIKGAQDIEKKYNLTILGSVPNYSKKKRGK